MMPGHPERIGAPGEVVDRRRRPQRAVLAVQVVGDDEHDRRLPDRGHVERLVERADVRRAVAEERQRDVRLAAASGRRPPRRPRSAGPAPTMAFAPMLPLREVDQVHRAADAAGAAGRAAHELREGGLGLHARARAPRRGRGTCWSGRRPGCIAAMAPTETASWPWQRCVVPWICPVMNSSWTFSSKSRMRTIVLVPVEAVGRGAGGSVIGALPPGAEGRRPASATRPGGTVSSFDSHRGIRAVAASTAARRCRSGVGDACATVRWNRYWNVEARQRAATVRASGRDWMSERRRSDARRKRASMREVADLADVAISSVSRVLSGHPDVSADMRERVLDAVRQLEYEPDFLAQSLRRGATLSVGYVVGDISNPLIATITSGAESVLRAGGLLDAADELGERPRARCGAHPVLPGAAGRRHDPVARQRAPPGDARRPGPGRRAGHHGRPRRRRRPATRASCATTTRPGCAPPSTTCWTSAIGGSR